MVDAAFLAKMKDGALLVNAARGVLVVTDDLVAEVSSGRLSAAMDVTDPEPLPAGPSALVHAERADHAAYRRIDVVLRLMAARFVREQAERYLAGQPLANVIIGDY